MHLHLPVGLCSHKALPKKLFSYFAIKLCQTNDKISLIELYLFVSKIILIEKWIDLSFAHFFKLIPFPYHISFNSTSHPKSRNAE